MNRYWLAITALIVPACAGAQDSTAQDSTKKAPPPAATSSTPAPRMELSGVIFANYQTGGPRATRAQNRFDVERVYVNFYAPAGDRVSIRFTTDIFVQRDSTRDGYYRGWTMRAKYAWLQYELMKPRPSGVAGVVRIGLIHTPIAEYEEGFFLRYVSPGSLDAPGFFSTADAGAASLWTFPKKRGEIYFSVLNGPGYTSRETDRFKDYGTRLSFTPFGARGSSNILTTLSLTPWYYKGWRASTAAGSIGAARQRDRYGFFAGLRDPRLRTGVMLARRTDQNDVAGTPTPVTVTGNVRSVFIVGKPGALRSATSPGRASLILRMDNVRPDDRSEAASRFLITGVQIEMNPRSALALDLQTLRPRNGSTAADTRTAFLHLVANF